MENYFAGAVVASRLSEIKHWRILLLEAGPDENEISDVSLPLEHEARFSATAHTFQLNDFSE